MKGYLSHLIGNIQSENVVQPRLPGIFEPRHLQVKTYSDENLGDNFEPDSTDALEHKSDQVGILQEGDANIIRGHENIADGASNNLITPVNEKEIPIGQNNSISGILKTIETNTRNVSGGTSATETDGFKLNPTPLFTFPGDNFIPEAKQDIAGLEGMNESNGKSDNTTSEIADARWDTIRATRDASVLDIPILPTAKSNIIQNNSQLLQNPFSPQRFGREHEGISNTTSIVKVSIGRIEIKATNPSSPAKTATGLKFRPMMSLDDYLKKENKK